jgi:hypothetical protein
MLGLVALLGGKPEGPKPAGPPAPAWGAPAPAASPPLPEGGAGDEFQFEAPPGPPESPKKPDILGMLLGGMLGKLKTGMADTKKHYGVFKSKKITASKKHRKEE